MTAMAEAEQSEQPAAAPAEKKVKAPPPEVLERVGPKKDVEEANEEELKAIIQEYYDRWVNCEDSHWDIEHSVKLRDMQIQELELECSDMRGKFIIPKLKKVHSFKLKEDEN